MRYARWVFGMLAELATNVRTLKRYTGPPVGRSASKLTRVEE